MLFDEEVLDFATRHFVAVITDHPLGKTEPKRNPDMWVQSESWKRSPNGAQLVWLVSADHSRRSGIVYSEYEDPAKLLGWMESVAVFDGRVAEPNDAQVRAAVIGHLRSELGGIWRSPNREKFDREFHELGRAFDRAGADTSDDELLGNVDPRELLARLREPSPERCAELGAVLGRLIAVARDAQRGENGWLKPFASRCDADQVRGESALTAAVALMRSWLARQIEAGGLEVDRELAAELKELGVRVAARDPGK